MTSLRLGTASFEAEIDKLQIRNPKSAIRNSFSGFLQNLHHAPTFACRQWSGLHDSNLVTDGRSDFIVRHETRCAPYIASIFAVQHQPVYAHNNGLLHLVRSHDANLLHATAL